MAEEQPARRWWYTLPGVLTAGAGIIVELLAQSIKIGCSAAHRRREKAVFAAEPIDRIPAG